MKDKFMDLSSIINWVVLQGLPISMVVLCFILGYLGDRRLLARYVLSATDNFQKLLKELTPSFLYYLYEDELDGVTPEEFILYVTIVICLFILFI